MSSKFGLPRIEPQLACELIDEMGLRDDDAHLVEAARRGHRGAGKRIYERHVEAVHAFLWRLLGPQPDFDDLVQDIFYFAFRSIHKLREPSSLRSWLFGITLGRVKARARSRHRKDWLSFAPSDELPEPSIEYDDASAEVAREVRELLERLPKEERLALVLHRMVGLPIDTSAKASGMSLSTFKRRLSRGENRFLATAAFRPAIAEWLENGRPLDLRSAREARCGTWVRSGRVESSWWLR